jgi:HPt (histidine-containing phosphotransfer) domain-containing protein
MVARHRPDSGESAIDREHLRRQTMDDETLALELVELFLTQSTKLLDIIAIEARAGRRRDAAHTLKGAAVAIGAFAVARQAEAVEAAAAAAPDALREEVERLAATLAASHAAIAAIICAGRADDGATGSA